VATGANPETRSHLRHRRRARERCMSGAVLMTLPRAGLAVALLGTSAYLTAVA